MENVINENNSIENNEELKNFEFKNRDSEHPERRLIKIINRSNDEILADIIRVDEEGVNEQGTEISAEIFENFQQKINDAHFKASQALATVGEASDLDVIEGQTKFNKNLLTNNEGKMCLRNYVVIGENTKILKANDGSIVIAFPINNGNEEILKIKKVSENGSNSYEITADDKNVKINGVSFVNNTLSANSASIRTITSETTFTGNVYVPDVTIS